jgi:hypothetical protein
MKIVYLECFRSGCSSLELWAEGRKYECLRCPKTLAARFVHGGDALKAGCFVRIDGAERIGMSKAFHDGR